jgi:hypothetical protein
VAAKAKITMSVQETVSDLSNLFKAMKKCKRGVSWKRSVIDYTQHGLYRLYLLKQDMDRGTYKPIEGYKFIIYEPKKRDIISTRFRDRVPQRSLVDNYLYDEVCSHFVPQNAACQKNKGTDYARNLLKANLREFYDKHGTDGYVLKIDVKSFFGSISHDIAKAVMRSLIRDDWAYQMVVDEIDSHSATVGIGLGSQLNQLIALAMLNGLDHKLLEDTTILYDRYMDDMLIIHHSKERLAAIKQAAAKELEGIGLRLNTKKTQIAKITQPVHFLGFSYLLHDTGRVTMKVLPAKISKRRRKLKGQIDRVKAGALTIEQVKAFYKGGRDHLKKGTRSSLAKMDKFYKTQMEELEKWMKSSNSGNK